jgi:uncharacterized protein (DUF305 family)
MSHAVTRARPWSPQVSALPLASVLVGYPIPAGALYTEADVRFMQGMIAHHAQAIHMSRMAATRGASPRLLRFAEDRQSQARDRASCRSGCARTASSPRHLVLAHMTMHGMLTAEELARARGARRRLRPALPRR